MAERQNRGATASPAKKGQGKSPKKSLRQSAERSQERGAQRQKRPWRLALESYLDHHRRVGRDSLRRLLKTPIGSALTCLVMGIALALPVGMMLTIESLQGVTSGWQESARISVYFSDQATVTEARATSDKVARWPSVASTEFIDRDAALAEFSQRSGLSDTLRYIDGNPLPHSLIVVPTERSRQSTAMERLITELEHAPGVVEVQVDMAWLARLNQITAVVKRLAWLLGLILIIGTLLVIVNTLRLDIENRREEIMVAKLVGATDTFVRRPFLYSGTWYGLGGGLGAILITYGGIWWLATPVSELAQLYDSSFRIIGPGFTGCIAIVLVAIAVGWAGASVAVRRHLDVIEAGDGSQT